MSTLGGTRLVRSIGRPGRRSLARALREISYEILPFARTEEQVLATVPKDVRLTVTTTEAKGLRPTVDLAVRLARHGYATAPHLAARLVRDRSHLDDIVSELEDNGVPGIFVIGGDAARPVGEFPDALSLLEALQSRGHRFRRIGIGAYPEGHGRIDQRLIEQALTAKSRHANLGITQLCFDPRTTASWARSVKGRGVSLPIRVGIPGAVTRQKLVRISAGLGLGQSARFLAKQQGVLARFFLPGGYSPDRLLRGLAHSIDRADNDIVGFHIFTFNELKRTEAWRQDRLARLA